jgi:ankyrin repeat protein
VQNITSYICCLCSAAIFTDIFPSFADTCWRRDTDSEPDEEPPPAKRQRTTDPQKNRTGGAHDEGQQFEIKMAAMIGLRGMERGDNFELATNVTYAGNFDDLVYTTNGRRYYLQLKHTENPYTTYLQPKDLRDLLHKCFESYYEMEDKDKSEFIIYTNKRLGRMLSSHERNDRVVTTVESVFKTSTKGEIFNFTRDDNNKKTDVYSGVEKLVKGSKEFGDLSVPKQNNKVSMINEFLEKLIMVIGQKGELKLDKVIYKEIKKRDEIKVGREVYEQVIRHFKMLLESWWRNRSGTMTPETLRNWLQEAKTKACASVIRSLFKSCTKKLAGTGMRFSDSEVSRLHTELSDERAIHLKSDALTLSSILLLDCLDTSKCIFVTFESLLSNKNMLIYAWLGGQWEWLIVFCDSTVRQSDISDTCREISKIITRDLSSKRVVILTPCSIQQFSHFVTIQHEFSFELLSVESQEIVLEKKIDFQGCEVTMRSVLQRHGNVEHVLGPELVTDLITDETLVNIGGRLQENRENHAHRILDRNVWLHLNVLQSRNSCPDIFAVSGMKEKSLIEIVPSGEIVGNICLGKEYLQDEWTENYDVFKSSRFIVMLSADLQACFLKLCEKHSGKNLHWVEFNNGDLLWKMSKGSTDSLLDYIDAYKTRADKRIIAEYMKRFGSCEVNEESIWNLKERTVLVVADPGMGKSSTTTQVAWHTKLADPTSWVVRVNWNEHSRKLEKLSTEGFNVDRLVDFFSCVVFPESKYCKVNEILLKQAVQNSGNVTVLTDGYDEISPTYAEKAAVILSTLMETKVGRVWVTSRPVVREKLEKELSVTAFTMKPLSRPCQEKMLLNCWMSKSSAKKDDLHAYIKRLLSHANESVHDSNFTGFPLYIVMTATAFEKNVERGDFSVPEKVDLLYLIERFVERKLHIYQIEKKMDDITNSSVQDDHELLTETFLNNFQRCALVVTLPSSILNLLHDKKIEIKVKPFLRRVQAGKDKTGVVIAVVEDRPHFVHRTFAEYFTAHWFSENFQSNRSVLEQILFDRSYWVVKDVLDRVLARDCPLHCAVLNWDSRGVESLLQEKCDVNSVDKGGRTAMHIIASQGQVALIEDITQSLLKRGNYFSEEDNVLKWTPLQYAIKSGSWFVAERLLERKVDIRPPDEEHIRQRVHDPDYIGPILYDAAGEDYLFLLKFLYSVGVDMDQELTDVRTYALHVATASRRLRIIRWLIEIGANCNTGDNNGWTPLFHAANNGRLDIIRMLVEEGNASVNVYDIVGRSALDWAINHVSGGKDSYYLRGRSEESEGRVEPEAVVKYLRERGCRESGIADGVVITTADNDTCREDSVVTPQ